MSEGHCLHWNQITGSTRNKSIVCYFSKREVAGTKDQRNNWRNSKNSPPCFLPNQQQSTVWQVFQTSNQLWILTSCYFVSLAKSSKYKNNISIFRGRLSTNEYFGENKIWQEMSNCAESRKWISFKNCCNCDGGLRFCIQSWRQTILKLNCKRDKCVGGSLVWIGREIYVKLTKIKPHGTTIKQQYSQD